MTAARGIGGELQQAPQRYADCAPEPGCVGPAGLQIASMRYGARLRKASGAFYACDRDGNKVTVSGPFGAHPR